MLYKKTLLIVVLHLSILSAIQAQLTGWEAGPFLGFAVYQGDLSQPNFLKGSNPAIGFTARYNYYYTLKFRANFMIAALSGDDRNAPERAMRGFRFTTDLMELSGVVEWEPLGRWREWRERQHSFYFSPYLLGGVGFCLANAQPMFPDLGAPGSQNPIQQDLQRNNALFHLVVPLGLGVRYDVNPEWMVSLEAGSRFPFTDYLDGISKAANPDAGDWYWFYGVNVMYRFY
ncbi:MAG: DUF6089 family protein [Saprospiraceae bacterium]